MKDGLTGGIDKAGLSVQVLSERAKAAAGIITAKIEEQRKVIDGVTADLNRMERQLAGMKPGTAQRELAAEVAACRKVLAEEKAALSELERQHKEAEKAVADLAGGHRALSTAQEQNITTQKSLSERIAESRDLVKYTAGCVKELEVAYKKAAPGAAKSAALTELNAAKKPSRRRN